MRRDGGYRQCVEIGPEVVCASTGRWLDDQMFNGVQSGSIVGNCSAL